jgi:integrase/recombinase XerD
MSTTTNITLMLAISTFLKIAMQGKSPYTKKWYQSRLLLMAGFLGETRKLSDIKETDLINWREKIEAQKLSMDTLHGYIRAARRIFKWLNKRGFMPVNIAAELSLPDLPKRGKSGISDEHARLILDEARRWSVRDYAILLFLASTSARRGGVAELRLTDLNLDQPEPECRKVTVFEKGKKERTVIMDFQTLEAMRLWISIRPGSSEFVFVSDKGEKLKVDSISEIIDRYKKRLGITGKCSPHQWRHRWFRRVLSNHMPLTQAAQIGGHESVELTYQYYGKYAMDELREAYDRYYTP